VGVLAFRGTEPSNFINWLTDANTVMRTFHYGSVHGGFFDNVEALWDGVAEVIDEAIQGKTIRPTNGDGQPEPVEPLQVLYVTGHSLGAAMAVVAAARIFSPDYRAWQPLVRGVYTFGQPMVGDAEFARKYGEQFGSFLYRHVFRHDVVPRLPPRAV